MRRTATVLILILSLLFPGLAVAGPLEDATKAYEQGDYKDAYHLFGPLAEQGLPEAQYNLGIMYSKGQGLPQDYAEAVKWCRKAAEQGYAPAQSNLGVMYSKGQGVPQDYVLAHMWFNLATSLYPASEKEWRDQAENERDIVASKLTHSQVSEAQRLAREWKPKKEE